MNLLLWFFAALFAWLAIDAIRTHGLRSPSFKPTDAGIPAHEFATKPIADRSGRAVALLFAFISALCVVIALLLEPQ